MTIKTVYGLYEAIGEGKYESDLVRAKLLRPDTIIDEDKSVKWNREEVQRRNSEQKDIEEASRKLRMELSEKLANDIIGVFVHQTGYSEKKVRTIYHYAYRESHSSGMYEVVQTMDELIDLFMEVDQIQ